ncbi:hypothetical protein VPH234P10_0024 [Vibrio phage 234P10]
MSRTVRSEVDRRLRRAQIQVQKYERRDDLSEHGEISKSYYLGKVSAYETILELIDKNLTPPPSI